MARPRELNSVAIVCPKGRHIVLRYWCPVENRKVRRSTKTYDIREAQEQAELLAAQLLTGSYERPQETTWIEFIGRYDAEELRVNHKPNGRRSCNRCLNAFSQLINPVMLSDAIAAQSLLKFRNDFAAGKGSRFGTRSPHTVASCMATVIAALNWANAMRMCGPVPKIPRFRPGTKRKAMKGRPIATEEFERMLSKVASEVGEAAADSWLHLLWGLWESGLRLGEALNMSWDLPGTVRPLWRRGALPTILIPGEMQKNGDDDEIPMLAGLEVLLNRTPRELRTGWVFEPIGLAGKRGRRAADRRLSDDYVSKVIERIGEAAGIIVTPVRGEPPKRQATPKPTNGERAEKPKKPTRSKTYTPPKFASAHDLRRSLADRLEAAGVDPLIIARVMRHRSYETTRKYYAAGNVQRDAAKLRDALVVSVSGHKSVHEQSTKSHKSL